MQMVDESLDTRGQTPRHKETLLSPGYDLNLLDEPLLRVRRAEAGRVQMTLPEVLAALRCQTDDPVVSFEGLRREQEQAWHCFLAQLGALVALRAGELPRRAEGFAEQLLGWTQHQLEPWCLLVEDLTHPAFMQPGVASKTPRSLKEAGFVRVEASPEELDVPFASKNHDRKRERIHQPRPEDWIYALVTAQTMQGYGGRGHYGIARMYGGYGNRTLVGWVPGLGWGPRWRHDVWMLQRAHQEILEDARLELSEAGQALLWTLPWSGDKDDQLLVSQLHPLFIEVCRRVRLARQDGRLVSCRATSKNYRIAQVTRARGGVCGDPWAPVQLERTRDGSVKARKVLPLDERGPHLGLMLRCLLGQPDLERPPSMRHLPREAQHSYVMLVEGLARDQGKTQGLWRRTWRVPAWLAHPLVEAARGSSSARADGIVARARGIHDIFETVRTKVLYVTLRQFYQSETSGAPKAFKLQAHMRDYQERVEAIFWQTLELATAPGPKPESWARSRAEAFEMAHQVACELAGEVLARALESRPMAQSRTHRTRGACLELFERRARDERRALDVDSMTTE